MSNGRRAGASSSAVSSTPPGRSGRSERSTWSTRISRASGPDGALAVQPRRQPFLDPAIGASPARRILAIAGGEERDPLPAFAVDPQSRSQSISLAGMADRFPAGAEQIVAAARPPHRQLL